MPGPVLRQLTPFLGAGLPAVPTAHLRTFVFAPRILWLSPSYNSSPNLNSSPQRGHSWSPHLKKAFSSHLTGPFHCLPSPLSLSKMPFFFLTCLLLHCRCFHNNGQGSKHWAALFSAAPPPPGTQQVLRKGLWSACIGRPGTRTAGSLLWRAQGAPPGGVSASAATGAATSSGGAGAGGDLLPRHPPLTFPSHFL